MLLNNYVQVIVHNVIEYKYLEHPLWPHIFLHIKNIKVNKKRQ